MSRKVQSAFTILNVTLQLMYSKADYISQGSVATRLECYRIFN